VTIVDELPKTSSGKILRRTVRDEATKARAAG
jgi:long-chain acyl-CoA synthetase